MVESIRATYTYQNVLFDVSSTVCEWNVVIAHLSFFFQFQIRPFENWISCFDFIPKWKWCPWPMWNVKRFTFHSIKLDVCIHVYTAITLISLHRNEGNLVSSIWYNVHYLLLLLFPYFHQSLILTFRSINNQRWKFHMSKHASDSLSLLLVVIMNDTRNLFTNMKILFYFVCCWVVKLSAVYWRSIMCALVYLWMNFTFILLKSHSSKA